MKTDAMLARAQITRTMSYETWRPCLWKYFDAVFFWDKWSYMRMSKHVESSLPHPIHYVMHNVFSKITSTSMKFYTEVVLLNTTTYTGIALIISFFFMISSTSFVKCMTPTSRDISHVHRKSHTQPEPTTFFSVSGYRRFYASCLLVRDGNGE